MSDQPTAAKSIFLNALEIPSGEARQAYLVAQCGGNEALGGEVEALLRQHGELGSFLESPAAGETLVMGVSSLSEGAGTIIGPYKLLQRIGEGGMGVVFMAEQQRPVQRIVALKIIKPGMDTRQVIARFEAERQALALMDHPNIAKVLDAGATDTGRPYFVMELVKGMPITQYCDEHHLTPRERLDLFVPVCQAVQHAHQKGIIHRDLKPSNVMIALYDGRPVPKIIDFGVAKATGRKLTERTMFTEYGAVVGTVEYMSPEQAELNQLDIDTRSDIYSLGVLLYELLTSTTPFDKSRLRSAAFVEMLRIIREEDPPKPSTRLSTTNELATIAADRGLEPNKLSGLMRGELDWIVMKCLEKDRNRRYETANGLARDIERYLCDEPVQACPPTRTYRLKKFLRRNERTVVAATVVVGALVAGVIGTTLGLLQAQHVATEKSDLAAANMVLARQEAAARATVERQDVSLTRGLFELAAAEHTNGDPAKGMAMLAKAYEATAKSDPQREDIRSLLSAAVESAPISLPSMGNVKAISYSPDGATVLTCSNAKTVQLWDASTGRPLGEPMTHDGTVMAVAFSPDGATVLTIARGEKIWTAQSWNARAGKPLGEPMKHYGAIIDAVYSPDRATVLTASQDKTARLWEARSGKSLGEPMRHDGDVLAMAYSPDGATVLTGSEDKTARLWDARTGKPLGAPMKHDAQVRAVAFSPDGATVLTGGYDGTARLWEARTGKPLGRPMEYEHGTYNIIESVAFSPDGATVLTGAGGLTDRARLWDARTGESLGQPMIHHGPVFAVAYSPDGSTVLTGSGDKTARLWDARTGKSLGEPVIHDGAVTYVAFSPDGATVLTGSLDQRARLRNTYADAPLRTLQHGDRVRAVAFSPDGTTVLTGSNDHTARLWDARTGNPIGRPMRHENDVAAVAYSPGGAMVLTGSADKTARLWDARTGNSLGKPMMHDDAVWSVAFSPDGTTVATGGADHTVRLWDIRTGKPLGKPIQATGLVRSVAFSPDGTTMLIGGKDNTARLSDVRTREPLGEPMRHDGSVFAVAFSRDGTNALTGGSDGTARLWDARSGRPLGEPMQHGRTVWSVAFSPDGETVVTGCEDKMAWLWNVRTGKPLMRLMQHDDRVKSVAFSPDGATVLTGSDDHTVRLWHISPPIPKSLILFAAAARGGMRMTESGIIRPLSMSEVSENWTTLEAEGADWLAEHQTFDRRRRVDWHEYEAAEAEVRGDRFAAAFHLQRLADQDPQKADWPQRLATARQQRTFTKNPQRIAIGSKSDWSPDATKLAISKPESGGIQDNGIQILDPVSGAIRDLVARGKDPAWSGSNDGPIAFVRMTDGGKEEVWLIRPDGTQERRIGKGGYPHWSGDGKTLYFHDHDAHSIMALTPSDPKAEPHVACELGQSDWPVVSPDGGKVAYVNGARGLIVETCPGREAVKSWALEGNTGGGLVAWHPDGMRLAFCTFGSTELWLASLETGKAQKIVDGAWKPAWSKDGERLLYVKGADICIVDANQLPSQ